MHKLKKTFKGMLWRTFIDIVKMCNNGYLYSLVL